MSPTPSPTPSPWSGRWWWRSWSRAQLWLARWLEARAPRYPETERLVLHLLVAGLTLIVLWETALLVLSGRG